jgi:predicted glycosyltransferase involved in capsule biosynthesis
MCERFAGYGSEDCEFWERLTRLTKMLEQRDLPLLHINHKRPFVYSQNVELYESLVKKPIEDRLLDLKIDLDKRILGAK